MLVNHVIIVLKNKGERIVIELLSRMDNDKKVRIINSAFEEFALHGYEKASTNEIVAKAGISKGLLFHYFGSKEKLYETLRDFAVDHVLGLLDFQVDTVSSDIFIRIQQFTSLKLKAMDEYPHIYDFLRRVMQDSSDMKCLFPAKAISLVEKAYAENIDYSLFKPGVDIEKALDVIHWTVDGITESMLGKVDVTIEEIIEEIRKYMDMLRALFYV